MKLARNLMVLTAVLLGGTVATAAEYGSIKGKQLNIGEDDKKVLVDSNVHFNLAKVGAKAGESCGQANAGALVQGDNTLPLVCYAGKWHQITPLSALNSFMDDCPKDHFLTVENGKMVCKLVAVSNTVINNTVNNPAPAAVGESLLCFKDAKRGVSPKSTECAMEYVDYLTNAVDFNSIQDGIFPSRKLDAKYWKKHEVASKNDLNKALNKTQGSWQHDITLNSAEMNFPYVVAARLNKGKNVSKTIELKTSKDDRVFSLGSGIDQYSMFIINKQLVGGAIRYQVLGAYFRDVDDPHEFKDGYYRLITLDVGETPQKITVTYEFDGDENKDVVKSIGSAGVYVFNGK